MTICDTCEEFDINCFVGAPDGRRGYPLDQTRRRAFATRCQFCELLVAIADQQLRGSDGANLNDLWIHLQFFQGEDESPPSGSRPGARIKRLRVLSRRDTTASQPKRRQGVTLIFMLARIHVSRTVIATVSPCPLTECFAASPAAMSGDVSGRYPGDDVLAGRQFDVLKQWLHECIGNPKHAQCNRTISGCGVLDAWNAPLPARCIHISSPQQVRLQETRGKTGAYVTLSHRWTRDTARCNTTTDNIAARLAGILVEALTGTFRDAIAIAHGLGVRYLWIDSICIVQDGDGGKDWREESPKMAEYYQGAIVTLAGTSSPPASGLVPNKHKSMDRELIRLPYLDGLGHKRGHFYLFKCEDLNNTYEKQVHKSILYTRGWVFQERLLSRRLLHYTPEGIVYECQSTLPRNNLGDTWREKPKVGLVVRVRHRTLPGREKDLQGAAGGRLSLLSVKDLTFPYFASWYGADLAKPFRLWYEIVEQYSPLQLSRQSDRVVALAGLVTEFRQFIELRSGYNTKCD
jgi:hypothetical protein